VLVGYSLKEHIYSGYNVIARYNSGNSIFFIAVVLESMNLKSITKKYKVYVLLAIFYVVSIVYEYDGYKCDEKYLKFNAISKFVLDNIPHFYIGDDSVFVMKCRGTEDNALSVEEPFFMLVNMGLLLKYY